MQRQGCVVFRVFGRSNFETLSTERQRPRGGSFPSSGGPQVMVHIIAVSTLLRSVVGVLRHRDRNKQTSCPFREGPRQSGGDHRRDNHRARTSWKHPLPLLLPRAYTRGDRDRTDRIGERYTPTIDSIPFFSPTRSVLFRDISSGPSVCAGSRPTDGGTVNSSFSGLFDRGNATSLPRIETRSFRRFAPSPPSEPRILLASRSFARFTIFLTARAAFDVRSVRRDWTM